MTATIALVGRTNVGKSTLFNRLTGKKRALVHDSPGVTRDTREGEAELYTYPFAVFDTAGFEPEGNALTDAMWRQTERALKSADAVVFVVDARAGVTPLDKVMAAALRKLGKPVILAANKAESKVPFLNDFFALGFGEPIPLSAEHGLGMGDLFESLRPYIVPPKSEDGEDEDLPERKKRRRKKDDDVDLTDESVPADDSDSRVIDLAIVGRPNVGKSTLVNRLLGRERMLTGNIPGLTRDAVSTMWEYKGRTVRLTDTAGLRKQARIDDDLERLSAADSKRAAFLAQVVVLVLDAAAVLDKQDLTIARKVLEEGRALVIAVNKWDAVKDKRGVINELNEKIDESLTQVKGLRTVTISARTGEGTDALMKAVLDVYAVWNTRVSTGKLNRWLNEMTAVTPPPLSATKRPIPLKYMTQIKTRPPTFALFSSNPEKLPESYLRYLIKGLARDFKMQGVPVRIMMRKAKNPYEKKAR